MKMQVVILPRQHAPTLPGRLAAGFTKLVVVLVPD